MSDQIPSIPKANHTGLETPTELKKVCLPNPLGNRAKVDIIKAASARLRRGMQIDNGNPEIGRPPTFVVAAGDFELADQLDTLA